MLIIFIILSDVSLYWASYHHSWPANPPWHINLRFSGGSIFILHLPCCVWKADSKTASVNPPLARGCQLAMLQWPWDGEWGLGQEECGEEGWRPSVCRENRGQDRWQQLLRFKSSNTRWVTQLCAWGRGSALHLCLQCVCVCVCVHAHEHMCPCREKYINV